MTAIKKLFESYRCFVGEVPERLLLLTSNDIGLSLQKATPIADRGAHLNQKIQLDKAIDIEDDNVRKEFIKTTVANTTVTSGAD